MDRQPRRLFVSRLARRKSSTFIAPRRSSAIFQSVLHSRSVLVTDKLRHELGRPGICFLFDEMGLIAGQQSSNYADLLHQGPVRKDDFEFVRVEHSRRSEMLVAASVHADRSRSESRKVREFIRQFAGLKRSDIERRVGTHCNPKSGDSGYG